jgi:hypothetical protein
MRKPSFALAEITWRWVFGAATTLLVCLSVYEYLRTLPVSGGDLLFLESRHPVLVSQAIAHILAGSARRFIEAALILVPCLGVFWIAAASLGRAATLRPLLEYFQTEAQAKDDAQWKLPLWHGSPGRVPVSSLVGLNFLRVAVTLAAVVALLGAGVAARLVSPATDPNPVLSFLVFVTTASLVGIVWSMLNWVLSLATIFVVRDGQDTFGSFAASLDFFRDHTGPLMWSSTAFGILHLVVFVVATSVVFLPTIFLGIVPAGLVLVSVLLLTLIYFAIVDSLYMGRLAAYVCILECPVTVNPAPPIVAPSAGVPASPTGDTYTQRLFPATATSPVTAPEVVGAEASVADREAAVPETPASSESPSVAPPPGEDLQKP